MDRIPIVSSFCGCIDLKVSCVVIAAFRLVVNILLFIYMILLLFKVIEIEEKIDEMGLEDNTSKLGDMLMFLLLVFVIIICLINIVCSYLFIKGITSNNPTKMKYYLILNVINIVLCCIFGIFKLNIAYLIVTALDSYLFICAYSIYKTNMNQLQEDTSNPRETTKTGNAYDQPQYGSAYEMEGGKTVTFENEEP